METIVTSSLSVIYEERNALALALAQLGAAQGWPVRLRAEADDPAWAVLTIFSPVGQLSYTIPAKAAVISWPEPEPGEALEAVPRQEGLARLSLIAQGAANAQ